MAVLQISRRAAIAIVQLRNEIEERVDKYPSTLKPPGFWKDINAEYERRLKSIIREGMEETRNDRDVQIRCADCGREGTVPGTQQRWTCSCSPHIERFVFATAL